MPQTPPQIRDNSMIRAASSLKHQSLVIFFTSMIALSSAFSGFSVLLYNAMSTRTGLTVTLQRQWNFPSVVRETPKVRYSVFEI